jgi:S-adenosylmethionine:tRNA ribosyltransferase-isomerase
MKLLDFDYFLPEELIARYPLEKREGSRLLSVHRKSQSVEDKRFTDINDLLKAGDVLVLNETKVIPARLLGTRVSTGASVEVFLLHKQADRSDTWAVLAAPAKKVKKGEIVRFSDELECEVQQEKEAGERIVRFRSMALAVEDALDKIGKMPIPPYLHRASEEIDKERYQTVFARIRGAVAAPTASLHFTEELLSAIEKKGVKIAKVLLHVGMGTFKPVEAEDIREHKMHSEEYEVSGESADIINSARKNGGRIIAVGTTAARTLETASDGKGIVHPASGETSIYIYPPYRFKAVDALLTNFHQPRSTLLMMISALAGYELIMKAYRHAIEERYRFLSYGDAMFIE